MAHYPLQYSGSSSLEWTKVAWGRQRDIGPSLEVWNVWYVGKLWESFPIQWIEESNQLKKEEDHK